MTTAQAIRSDLKYGVLKAMIESTAPKKKSLDAEKREKAKSAKNHATKTDWKIRAAEVRMMGQPYK